jgi:hypothetical protein
VGGGKEIPGGFVVAGCDRPELPEFAEESLDQVALFVEFSIEFARRQAVGSAADLKSVADNWEQQWRCSISTMLRKFVNFGLRIFR